MKFVFKGHHESNAKAILSLLIVLVAFGIFLLFVNYKDNLIASGSLQPFITMAIIAGGFLVGLLFLVNKPQQKHAAVRHVHHTTKSSKTKKKSRRK